jgi:hypothetical protein
VTSPPSEPYATTIRAPGRPDGGLRVRIGGRREAVEAASAPRGCAPSTAFDGDVRGGWRGVTVPSHRSSPCSMLRAAARGGLGRVDGVDGEAMFVRGWADDVGSLKDGMLVRGGGEKQG